MLEGVSRHYDGEHKPIAICSIFCYNILYQSVAKPLIIKNDYGQKEKIHSKKE
jgi:hypothetical protein